jgi:hypothetical protein
MFKVWNIPRMFIFRGALRIVRASGIKKVLGKSFGLKTTGYFHPVFEVITEHGRRKSK